MMNPNYVPGDWVKNTPNVDPAAFDQYLVRGPFLDFVNDSNFLKVVLNYYQLTSFFFLFGCVSIWQSGALVFRCYAHGRSSGSSDSNVLPLRNQSRAMPTRFVRVSYVMNDDRV